jgi:perosamine synthetase
MSVRSRIPLARPMTSEEELAEVREVLDSGQLSQGPKTAQFEAMVAELVVAEHALATSSCTTALHLALAAAGIGPGDEVLVPDFTFPATANVVVQCGAKPVLVDIDLETYNLDPEDLGRHLSPRTRAIIPVHLFGLAADMDAVRLLAADHGLVTIEDAACALGASYRGQPCGTLGDMGCFSFHARKVITTGEGGMVVTDRTDLAERLQLLRSHGGLRGSGRFVFEEAGFNYRLSDIHAAVGIAQLRRLPDLVARRRALAGGYRARLADVPGVRLPGDMSYGSHVYQSFVILLDQAADRDHVVAELSTRGIETTIGTYALHAQPFFRRTFDYVPGQLPQSYAAFRHSIALPLFPTMTEEELDTVAGNLSEVLSSA